MSKKDLYKELFKEYEDLRHNNLILLNNRREDIYIKFPEIKEIDETLKNNSISLSKQILQNDKEGRISILNDIKNSNKKLLINKANILIKNGYDKDYLSISFNCKKCEDTGFLNDLNDYCVCFKQKLINKTYKMSTLENIIQYENFDTFDLRYYSKEVNSTKGISPFENIKLILKKSIKFIDNFDNEFQNIIFTGGAGLGKTFLCNCIAKDILDKGKIVLYTTAFNIFDTIEKVKFNKELQMENPSDFIDLINEADLLIVDDLGTEFITSLSSSELFNFLNNRILNKKSTIVSTNLSLSQLMEQYSSRIASRFFGDYELVEFFGDDIRIMKKSNPILK